MIEKFIETYMKNKHQIEHKLKTAHVEEYKDLVKMVIETIHDEDDYESPDPERIHEINDGDYQGTLLYLIAASGYQPDRYWYVKIAYGSCSGCDTLQNIQGYSDEPPTEQQIKDYMTLALHIVQGLKETNDDSI